MPDPWMPGLNHDPGRSAGYNAGSCRMQFVVHHDTAGTNSYNICKWGRVGYNAGLCQILLPKIGVPWQFCEINALCYHAGSAQYGDYNGFGPGFEVERLGHQEPLSDDQVHWLHEINLWCASEWGVPNVQYRGAHGEADNFNGHVNHSDLHPNPDGLTYEEWDTVTAGNGPVPTPELQEAQLMELVALNDGTDFLWVDDNGDLQWKHLDANGNAHTKLVTGNANANHRIITVDRVRVPGTDAVLPILYLLGPQLQTVRVVNKGLEGFVAEYV